MGRASIMVVDDVPSVRDLADKALRSAGFEVVLAATGEQALEIAAEQRLSAVLLDIQMPGINGINVLRKLRLAPQHRNVPVLLMSIEITRALAEEAQSESAGPVAWLLKPFKGSTLVASIQKLVA